MEGEPGFKSFCLRATDRRALIEGHVRYEANNRLDIYRDFIREDRFSTHTPAVLKQMMQQELEYILDRAENRGHTNSGQVRITETGFCLLFHIVRQEYWSSVDVDVDMRIHEHISAT